MAVTTTKTNKPINPRGNDQSPKGYNRAALYSGKALDFDGVNDSISVPYSDTLGGVWTWVSIIEADALSGYQELFGGQYDSGNATIYLKENQLSFYTIADNFNTAFNFETGKKYHVACSQSGDTISVYVNGQAAGSVSLTIPLNRTGGVYIIGKNPTQSKEYFNGKMSGVKLFNTALTAAQVSDLYNNPEKIVPTGVADTALKLWLPMMEGAGTTAYDGSGNGNHGTISGATYVNGVGSPVAQSAVIDWNKLYDFDGVDDQAYNTSYADTTGTKTYKVHFNSHDVTQQDQQIIQSFVGASEQNGFGATIAPFGGNSNIAGLRVIFGGVSGAQLSWPVENNTFYELVFTIDWDAQVVSNATLNGEAATGGLGARVANPSGGLYIGSRVNTMYLKGIVNYFEVVGEEKWTNASGFKSESGSYDMTITGSPSQVLAPQGLTSGRDITGVNLFENVRKQGALNLDGNSWAEVHDNASLDFGTGSFTLECWLKYTFINSGSGANTIMGLGGLINDADSAGLSSQSDLSLYFWYKGVALSMPGSITIGDWVHFVGTYDGTNATIYVNGAQSNQGARTAGSIDNEHPVLIGRDDSGQRSYKDSIAQPRIYNRALTAEEVERNYNAGKNIYK